MYLFGGREIGGVWMGLWRQFFFLFCFVGVGTFATDGVERGKVGWRCGFWGIGGGILYLFWLVGECVILNRMGGTAGGVFFLFCERRNFCYRRGGLGDLI